MSKSDLQMGFFEPMPIAPPTLGEMPQSVGRKPIEYADARSILNKATGFMGKYDYTLNPAAGCLFACGYCYAANFSRRADAVESWGEWAAVKRNALKLLARKHPAGSLDSKLIYASTTTDPYQPFERKLRLTRGIFEILAERHKPNLVVQTRSPLVVRDIDLFQRIERNGGRVQVNMTVTAPPTAEGEAVRKAFEPECPSNRARLKAIAEVQMAGVQACVTMTPALLIDDASAFADTLLATGVERFIIQPFHLQSAAFKAGTREKAIGILTDLLGCKRRNVIETYMRHYERARAILAARLPSLGEGKDGFAPPF